MKQYLNKGESLVYLGFTLLHCTNGDGMVLLSPGQEHMGNYGYGSPREIDNAKQAAIIFYMLSKPDIFGMCLLHKIMQGTKSGTSHEWFLLRDSLKLDKLKMPEEITCGQDLNCMIYYKNKPLQWL